MTLDVCTNCQRLLGLDPSDGVSIITEFVTEVPRRIPVLGCHVCDVELKAAARFEGKDVVRALARRAVQN